MTKEMMMWAKMMKKRTSICATLMMSVDVPRSAAGSRPSAARPRSASQPRSAAHTPAVTARPVEARLVARSSNGAGALFNLSSPAGATAYRLGAPSLINLTGAPRDIGEAYGELLAVPVGDMYAAWFQPAPSAETAEMLDWLWNCSLRPGAPAALVDEIEATEAGGLLAGLPSLQSVQRVRGHEAQ